MNQIWLLLGLKPEGFNSGLKRARDDVKGFEKTWKDLGKIFAAGGVTTAALGFFRAVIDHTREAKGAIDDNQVAVRNFARGMDEAKESSLSWGAQLLGFFNQAGEGWGLLTRTMVEGWENTKLRIISGREELGGFKKAWDDVGAAHRKDVELTKQDAASAEQRKADAAEDKRLREDHTRLLKQQADLRLKDLTAQERVNSLTNDYLDTVVALANYQGNALARRALENDQLRAGLALLQAQQDLKKDDAATAKKVDDELEKFHADVAKTAEQRAELQQKLNRLVFEQKSVAEQVTILAGSQAALEATIADRKRDGHDTLQQEVELQELTIELAAKRVELTERNTQAEAAAAKLLEAQRKSIMGFPLRGHAQFEDASDAALQTLLTQLKQRVADNFSLMQQQGNLFSLTTLMDSGRAQAEAEKIRRELDFRSSFRRDYQLGGEDRARERFAGDPLSFDELLSRLTGSWGQADATNELLRENNATLRDGFNTLSQRLAVTAPR